MYESEESRPVGERLRSQGDGRVIEEVPDRGTAVWMRSDGTILELGGTSDPIRATDPWHVQANGDTPGPTCPACDRDFRAETFVREHLPCGHVAVENIRQADGSFACPGCGEQANTADAFPIISLVWTCLACGYVSDDVAEPGEHR